MKTKTITLAASSLGLMTAVALSSNGLAQPTEQIIDEIRVEAPRMVQRERLPRGRGEQVSLAYTVTFADLVLTQTADVRELENRVNTAANEVCQQLETMFPQGSPPSDVCVRQAFDSAMAEVRRSIDVAVAE